MRTNNFKLFGLFAFAFFFFASSSFAAPPVEFFRWEKLGQRNVNHKLDRDEIYVTAAEGRFTGLRLKVEKSSINLHRVTVHYRNGKPQTINVRQNVHEGQFTRVLDLDGRKRIITKVVFWYDTKASEKRRGRVELWGKH